MRAVLDANVLVSATLSRHGAPAALVAAWLQGRLDIVACPHLLVELRRALAYPQVRARVPEEDALSIVDLVQRLANLRPDPTEPPPIRSRDSDDDYLIALAARERVPIVSGDRDLLDLAPRIPVLSAREALERLA